MGPIAASNEDGLTFTYRMFGALGRVSNNTPQPSIRTKDL